MVGLRYSSEVVGYVIPGNSGAVGKAVFAPKEGHGANILTELGANTSIITTKLTGSSNYLLTGSSEAFRQVSLVTDVKDKISGNYATKQTYIGPDHSSYGLGTLNEINNIEGYLLYVNNIVKVVRDANQEENIRICITF